MVDPAGNDKNTAGGGIASVANKKVANPFFSSRKRQLDFYSGQHKCQTCGKPFDTEKGVHGHMKMQKGKKASGAFPLPAFTHPSGSSLERGYARVAEAVQLATVLLHSSARQVHSASASALASRSAKHLVIDLNRPPPPDEEDGDVHKKEGLFDLNKPPSPEKEDGDDWGQQHGTELSVRDYQYYK